jgi:D-aspartate ligase
MNHMKHPSPAVILLAGEANALSVARSLGRRGIRVYAINHPDAHVRRSRYCQWLPVESGLSDSRESEWKQFLLGSAGNNYHGAILLTCSDAGLQFIARHRQELAERFLLDESNPEAQLRMLDKLATYRSAVTAGVATPRFWTASSLDEIRAVRDQFVFPLIIKPLVSHTFFEQYGRKFIEVQNYDELVWGFESVREAGIELMLVEKIPGPDDLLCSYYTYLDNEGRALFHFTKRVVRRFPVSMGTCCYHVTDWIPDLGPVALQLFRHVGLRGLANVEFKRDPRDGKLKLIECNARFTAANQLVAASGYDLAWLVYCRLTGVPEPRFGRFLRGQRLWYPRQDLRSFRELRRRGELSLGQWLWSLRHPKMLPFFRWDDPLPSIINETRHAWDSIGRQLRVACGATRPLSRILTDKSESVRLSAP